MSRTIKETDRYILQVADVDGEGTLYQIKHKEYGVVEHEELVLANAYTVLETLESEVSRIEAQDVTAGDLMDEGGEG